MEEEIVGLPLGNHHTIHYIRPNMIQQTTHLQTILLNHMEPKMGFEGAVDL